MLFLEAEEETEAAWEEEGSAAESEEGGSLTEEETGPVFLQDAKRRVRTPSKTICFFIYFCSYVKNKYGLLYPLPVSVFNNWKEKKHIKKNDENFEE
jgi:hypothetical protein